MSDNQEVMINLYNGSYADWDSMVFARVHQNAQVYQFSDKGFEALFATLMPLKEEWLLVQQDNADCSDVRQRCCVALAHPVIAGLLFPTFGELFAHNTVCSVLLEYKHSEGTSTAAGTIVLRGSS